MKKFLLLSILLLAVVANAQHAYFRGTNNYVAPVAAVPTTSNGLGFDGIDDGVVLNSSLLSSNTNELTYELWLKPYQLAGFTALLNHDSWSTGYVHFQFHGNNIGFDINGGNDNVFSYAFNTNTWYHVALVYSSAAGTLKFYVNGLLLDTVTNNSFPSIAGNVPISMGAWANGRFFNGVMDEVRIWNVARTQSEIQSNMNSELAGTETGLVAYYPFNQGIAAGNNTAISNVIDKTPNARNGVLNNFAKTGTTSNFVVGKVANVISVPRVISNGLQINYDASSPNSYPGTGTIWSDISGANNHAALAGNPAFTATAPSYFTFTGGNNANVNFAWSTDFTCSLWIYPISGPGGQYSRIVSTNGDNFEIAISNNNQLSYYSPTVSWQSNITTLASATWSQVVFVKSSNSLSIYVNNVLVRNTNIGAVTGNRIYLGQRHNTGEGSNVRMGSFLIYNYGLSTSDLSSNWNSQKTRFGY